VSPPTTLTASGTYSHVRGYQPLGAVFLDRLQHAEAGFATGFQPHEHALVDQ